MAEYINREALLQAVLELPPKMDEQGYGWLGRRGVWQMVLDFPAADVRPVVFCRDCKNDYHCMIQDFMEDYGITPDDRNNFFCGYGEKEDKKDER